jgi:P63C domain-containing protein
MPKIAGKALGGKARMEGTTAKERRALAKKAAAARWSGDIKQATHGSPDHPLRIGDIEIPCYVLEDGRRVIVQGGMMTALDMKQGTAGRGSGDRLVKFIATKAVFPYADKQLVDVITDPIKFRIGSALAYGYEATILADICDAVLKAREHGDLHYQQEHIAQRCEILVRAFARVGIIALVDEATGYQRDRAKDALSRILEAFIAKELQPWLRTFPADFYQEMFRLRGMEYPNDTVQRPRYFGVLTNDVVYDRLAPGVLEQLKKINPKDETGRRKHKNFQWLTRNLGYPKLREHLGAVVATMKLSSDWYDFKAKLDKNYPRIGKPTQLEFDYEKEEAEDTGQGL